MSYLKLHPRSPTELHGIFRLLSIQAPAKQVGIVWPAVMWLLRLASAALLVWIGAVHLILWLDGYRQIPTDGPFFLVDAVVGFAGGAVVLFWPRPIVALLGAGFTISTLAALIISINIGLFGFKEQLVASYVVLAIVLEAVATVLLMALSVLGAAKK
ncbi:MAG: conserved rane protein of unknown function [Acidimicrobiaceae bacterium]|nr:conserved rane protein of unknown function [Acidimicrobiaceae bacterium]